MKKDLEDALTLLETAKDKIGEDSLSDEGFYDVYQKIKKFLATQARKGNRPSTRPISVVD